MVRPTRPTTRRLTTAALVATALVAAAVTAQWVGPGPGSAASDAGEGALVLAELVNDTNDTLDTGAEMGANVSFVDPAAATSESAGEAAIAVRTSENSMFTSVEVTYNVTGGTAGAADFSGGDGNLTFDEPNQTRWIRLDLHGDAAVEGDETVVLNLSSEDPMVSFDVREHVHTLLDDDEPNRPPDAGSLSFEVEAGASYEGQLPATDPDGDDLTWSVAVQPAQGTLSLDGSTGEFTYVADPGASGSDTFDFRVGDGEATDLGHVDVTLASGGSGGSDGSGSATDGGSTTDGGAATDGDTTTSDGGGTDGASGAPGDGGSPGASSGDAQGQTDAEGSAGEPGRRSVTTLGWVGLLGGVGVAAYAYVKDRRRRFFPP